MEHVLIVKTLLGVKTKDLHVGLISVKIRKRVLKMVRVKTANHLRGGKMMAEYVKLISVMIDNKSLNKMIDKFVY